MIVIDHLTRTLHGSRSTGGFAARSAMRQLEAIATRRNCAIVMLAHLKGRSNTIDGHPQFRRWASTVLTVFPCEVEHDVLFLYTDKQRSAPKSQLAFKRLSVVVGVRNGAEVSVGVVMYDRDVKVGARDDHDNSLRVQIAAVMQPSEQLSLRKLCARLGWKGGGGVQNEKIKAVLSTAWVRVRLPGGEGRGLRMFQEAGRAFTVVCADIADIPPEPTSPEPDDDYDAPWGDDPTPFAGGADPGPTNRLRHSRHSRHSRVHRLTPA